MLPFLTFNGASRHDPAVAAWFAAPPAELKGIAQFWFAEMRACGNDVLELFHDGCPVACVGVGPFGYVNAFRSHVNVGFYQGAALPDPTGWLEGTGKHMRHVKVRPGIGVDEAALKALIRAAYADIQSRLAAG